MDASRGPERTTPRIFLNIMFSQREASMITLLHLSFHDIQTLGVLMLMAMGPFQTSTLNFMPNTS